VRSVVFVIVVRALKYLFGASICVHIILILFNFLGKHVKVVYA
jgi:hypothetical protein